MHCIKLKSLGWTPFLCALLAGATLAAYWPVFHNDFIRFDDRGYVTDNPHVVSGLKWENIKWALTSDACSNWHPMTWMSHMLDVELFGLRPAWHHSVSLLFHITNSLLLLLALNRMTGALWRSALVAALFALHPLHVESVAWAAERKDVLSTFFFMLTLIAYVKYVQNPKTTDHRPRTTDHRPQTTDHGLQTTDHRPPSVVSSQWSVVSGLWYTIALVFFALGLMSKPMLVTMPFVLLLLDFWPLRRVQSPSSFAKATEGGQSTVHPPSLKLRRAGSPRSKIESRSGTEYGTRNTQHAPRFTFRVSPRVLGLALEKIPFLALSGASSLVTFLVQQKGHAVSTAEGLPLAPRLATSVVAYVKYLGKMFWPAKLAVFYPHPGVRGPVGQYPAWFLIVAALLLGVITLVVLLRFKRAPWLATGWFWYLGTLVPVIGIVQVGGQEMADRYTYIPLIGIFIAVVWELADFRFSIFDFRFRKPEKPLPQAASAGQIEVQGSKLEVQSSFSDTSASPPADRPNLQLTQLTQLTYLTFATGVLLACVYLTHRQVLFWHDNYTLFKHALAVTRNNAPALYYNGVGLEEEANALQAQGKSEEAKAKLAAAEEKFKDAIQTDPSISDAYYSLGVIYANRGQAADAIAQYEAALKAKPWNAVAYNGLGAMYWSQGKNGKARTNYVEALRLDPDMPEAHFNLATLLFSQGDWPGAELHYAQTVRCRPADTEALSRLATVRVRQGKLREAEADLRELVRSANSQRSLDTQSREDRGQRTEDRTNSVDARHSTPDTASAQPSNPQEPARAKPLSTETDGSLASLHYSLGDVLRLEGRTTEAAGEFAEAVRFKPDHVLAVTALGRMLAAQGKLAEAEARFRDAVRLQPTNAEIHLTLGGALMVAGKTNEAAACFAKARQLDPGLAVRNLDEGKALVQTGDPAAAMPHFIASLSLEPDNPSTHAQLGHLLLTQGDFNGSLAQVREALRLVDAQAPIDPIGPVGPSSNAVADLLPALNDLAWLLATAPQAQLRNGTQAVALAERACQLSGGKQARFWGTLDAAYAEASRWDDAITTAEKTRALAMASGETNLCALASQRLQLYMAHQPFRQ